MVMGTIIGIIVAGLLLLGGLSYGIYMIYVIRKRTYSAKPSELIIVSGRKIGTPETDKTVVENGKGSYVKLVRGGEVRKKFLQNVEVINLNSFQLELAVDDITVKDDDRVIAKAVVQLAIGKSDKQVLNYSEQFSGKTEKEVHNELIEILTAHFRAILTTLTVAEINADRKTFNSKVLEISQSDLDGLGFEIKSFGLGSLKDFDENGYLTNVSRQRKAIMLKQTESIESENLKEQRIKKAQDEKLAKEVENEQSILIAESNKERELKEAEIKSQTGKSLAQAETVYELEKSKQLKQIEIEQTEVEKVRQEREKELAVIKAEEEKQVALKNLEKERLMNETQLKIDSEKAKNISEIELVKTKTNSEKELLQSKAEAEKIKLLSQAEAEKVKQQAESEATKLSKLGQAEAEAELAKGKAIAESERKMVEAKMLGTELILAELAIKSTPEIAKAIGQAIGAIDEVKVFSDGGTKEGISNAVTNSMSSEIGKTYSILKDLTGIDLKEVVNNKSKAFQTNVSHNYYGEKSQEAEIISESKETENLIESVTENISESDSEKNISDVDKVDTAIQENEVNDNQNSTETKENKK